MGWGRKLLSGIGTIAGMIALVSLGITIVVVGAMFIIGLESLGIPAVGPLVMYAPAAVTISGFLIWLLSKLGLWLTAPSESKTAESSSAPAAESAVEETQTTVEDHLGEFNKANLYIAVIFGVLFGIAYGSSTITNLASGTPFGIIAGFLVFAAQITGGTTIHALNLAVFGGAWFGIGQYNATEAWLAGMIGWGLLALSGVYLLSVSLGAIAIVVGGLKVLSTGYKARGTTDMVFLDDYLEEMKANAREATNNTASPEGTTSNQTGGSDVFSVVAQRFEDRSLRNLNDIQYIIDVDPEFVHPQDAENDRLTYWSYLSYGLGGLMILSSLLVGISVWGFPSYGRWGLIIGALYVAHGFGLPQRSAFVHAAGLGWYGLFTVLAVLSLSPLAIIANAAGVYLGWSGATGIRQPDEVLSDVLDPDASAVDADGAVPGQGLVGSGLAGGVILGGVLGIIGAVIFAFVSVQTQAVYGLLLLLPAIASGFGVSMGAGEQGSRLTGIVGAGVAVVSIIIGFRLLSSWMPQGYQLQPDILLAVVPFLGIFAAYKLAASSDESGPADGTDTASGASVESGSDN